ncbi:zinc ABC transporter substrate-binding protein [Shewanella sp. 202IG2-18]|uniref:metal ABC transporter solute-binding protein, Zn/Mn family n=1 Tax=Parashewanella hymeniacidonis TaxID=2807618 RepID=UPI001960A768|nr:zinc ABC transporter substrate-binding protein [Parashewanella hymeniacidonis]
MRISSKLLLATALFGLSQMAHAALNVFACEPEYAALVKEIAPEANVYQATTAMQDPHMIQARPSLIAKMRRTDLVVCAGADLEIGWLPMLQLKAANPKVRDHQTGLFFAAEHTNTLDKLDKVDRSMGDVHALGNPHLHFSPQRMLEIADGLTVRLIQLDADHRAQYQANFDAFKIKWNQAKIKWKKLALPLNGKSVIAYHSSFRYLFDWLGIKQVGDLEPKPGLPPTTSHLASLLKVAEQDHVSAIVVSSYQDQRGGEWLSKKANIPVLILPMTIGGDKQSKDLFSLYDSVIAKLLKVMH